MGLSSPGGRRGRHRWAVRLAQGLIVVGVVFIVSMTWLTQCTHGEISLGSLVSNWNPALLEYEVRVVFKDQASADFELLAPIPLIDGQEVPGFREAVARYPGPAEVVETERGKFVRITPGYTGDRSSLRVYVGLQLKEAPRRFLASTHLADRFSLSGQQNDGQAWVYLRSDREIIEAWISLQLGNRFSGLKSEFFWIPEGPVEPGWRLLPEGVRR